MDQNYKRKRKEGRLRQRLTELNLSKTELYGPRTSNMRTLDYWSVVAEQEAIIKQITDIERRLLIRRE